MSKSNRTQHDQHPRRRPNTVDTSQSMQPSELKAEYHYESSWPHPSIVEGYKNIDASFPERILLEVEKNGQHFRDQDSKALQFSVEEKKRGQYMAFAIIMTGMIATIVTAFLGMDSAAIVSAIGTAAIIFKGVFTKN